MRKFEISALTLREHFGLEIFETKVPARIFESKRGQLTEGHRKSHYEDFPNFNYSPIIRAIKSRARVREMRNAFKFSIVDYMYTYIHYYSNVYLYI